MADELTRDQLRAEWKEILQGASAALADDPSDEEALEAVQAARSALLAMVEEDKITNTGLADQEMREARDPGALGAFGLGASQGATFGFSDELAGLARGAMAMVPGGKSPGQAYREQVDETREAARGGRESHPIASIAGEVAGALAAPIPFVGPAGKEAATIIRATRAGRVAHALGRGARAGAVAGALEGAGRTEGDLGERAEGAAAGAATGAVAGAVIPPTARYAGKVAGRVLRPVIQPAKEVLGEITGKTAQRTATREALELERLHQARLRTQQLEAQTPQRRPAMSGTSATEDASMEAPTFLRRLKPEGDLTPGERDQLLRLLQENLNHPPKTKPKATPRAKAPSEPQPGSNKPFVKQRMAQEAAENITPDTPYAFGKYKDAPVPLKDVPDTDLVNALKLAQGFPDNVPTNWVTAIREEIARRGGSRQARKPPTPKSKSSGFPKGLAIPPRRGRMTTATVEGVKYEIPEMWLVGMRQAGYSTEDAIAHWAQQTEAQGL